MGENSVPRFTVGDVTILADGTRVYSVYAFGWAPLSGGGTSGRPAGILIGRVWRPDKTWTAAPERLPAEWRPWSTGPDSWRMEVDRAERGFATRREASTFLLGYHYGAGRMRFAAVLAAQPPALQVEI